MKSTHKKLLIGAAIICILALFVLLQKAKGVDVATDKIDYQEGSSMLVNIKNGSLNPICFSSCYPYYLEEKQESRWTQYEYGDCAKKDEVKKCIPQNEVKVFKIILSQVDKGFHRLRIPACVGCEIGQEFRSDKVFYSNLFEIK